ncbi:aryl-sulfate sulfotransferase [Christiangramia forsetii]|uniref:Secreted protein n=2 Tax=Christiangramia forsetii TaxID=411153 RepID=A0M5H1_CHRFK|nr:aryl-sulfate sulfotransferase [Christiangramia forsetii]GGG32957.1 hypothetical protein GCM10011532_15710 [Christiangramia forsetii]CAL67866.1 conserved hypothetical protein, secreted [Christiangramia forsetii KT0803]
MGKLILFALISLFLFSCSGDDTIAPEPITPEPITDEDKFKDIDTTAGKVMFLNEELADDNYVLVNDAAANRVFLIEKGKSKILNEWNLSSGIGNDAELLPNGNLLASLIVEDPRFSFGGYGGIVSIISPTGAELWKYEYSSEDYLAHHDVEMLPNGNVLILAWDKKSGNELIENGYGYTNESIYVEKLIEVNPNNDQIVWKWNSWDHLIQDYDVNAKNFGNPGLYPQKIDLNYRDSIHRKSFDGDIMHANGIEYDERTNTILVSVNYYSEVWVVDHSTTSEQAAGTTGGNYGKGGEILYRIGNPDAYGNPKGQRLFYSNHDPNIVPGTNNLLIYVNGNLDISGRSTVYELGLPDEYSLQSETNNELEIIWEYSHEDLFSPKVSGAYRLRNGNTLITEGTSGFWEVTQGGEIVWRFEGDGFYWRGYPYYPGDPELSPLGY